MKTQTPNITTESTDEIEFKELPELSLYSISNNGEIFNTKRKRFLKKSYWGKYKTVTLYDDKNKMRTYKVHTLVAKAFVPNLKPEIFDEVNHLDLDKGNNYYKNLEWTTGKLNVRHAIRLGAFNNRGQNNANAKLTNRQVQVIRELLVDAKTIAYLYGVSPDTIRK